VYGALTCQGILETKKAPQKDGSLALGLAKLSNHDALSSPQDSSVFKVTDEDFTIPVSRDQDPGGKTEGHALDGGGMNMM
jgi:hypothetical protein